MNADASESPRPIHAVFHSHSLRRQISDFGVDFVAVGPGIRSRDVIAVITPGTIIDTMSRTATETVSPLYG